MPSRSRNRSSLTHRRRRTTSSRMSAMWAAGPPKPITPSFENSAITSRRPPGTVVTPATLPAKARLW